MNREIRRIEEGRYKGKEFEVVRDAATTLLSIFYTDCWYGREINQKSVFAVPNEIEYEIVHKAEWN
jgi:hypothetical protein